MGDEMGHRFIGGSCRNRGPGGELCRVSMSRGAEPCVGDPAEPDPQPELALEPKSEEDEPAARVEEGGHDRQEKRGRKRAKKAEPAGDEDDAA